MKYALTAIISSAYYMNLFLKPVFVYNYIVKSSNRLNITSKLCRWYSNLLWTNFSPSTN